MESKHFAVKMQAVGPQGTGHCRHGGYTYQSRMGGSARSRSQPLRTKSSRERTAAVLNAIYEEDFLGFSYGFRPGRGAHFRLRVRPLPAVKNFEKESQDRAALWSRFLRWLCRWKFLRCQIWRQRGTSSLHKV
jgi:hypothetical protein